MPVRQVAATAAVLIGFFPAHCASASWTVMLFMNGKSALECSALKNLQELAAVGSTEQVNFLVELGRPAQSNGCASFPSWHGTQRYRITRNMSLADRPVGPENPSFGDMGSAKYLADFVRWGMDRYPADHYLLVIWGHRNGADPETGSKLPESLVHDELLPLFPNRKLDVLGYDSCHMASIETAYAMRDVAGLL